MPRTAFSPLGVLRLAAAVATLLIPFGTLSGQVVPVSGFEIGSSNPVTAEPLVARPTTTPCIVPLLQNQAFADFSPKIYSYTPPAACPGPWAKVVFTADFTVTAGRQYDRTAAFYLGHANIYYGTTSEPRKALSPSWHLERDVTDLSPIFKTTQSGQADLGNFVGVYNGVTYDGIIYANAALEFYPSSPAAGAPVTPDIVVPINGTGGDAGTLNTTMDQITQTLNLPKNIERVYLDVIAQSQSSDEQWFLCVPSGESSNLITCGNTAFRETEITIDGKPAGVAPVYPWIYTGGLDPYLWEPVPGIQTLEFKPYRVDLTPFAGVLSDGNPHVVAVSVFNANSYFLATANLLAYEDHGSTEVTGVLLGDTLSAAPTPTLTNNIHTFGNDKQGFTYTGSVNVASQRAFSVSGFVNTSHGRVTTTVEQSVNFKSAQQFHVTPAIEQQFAQQTSTVDSKTTTSDGNTVTNNEQHFSYPIDVDYLFVATPSGGTQTITIDQNYIVSDQITINGSKAFNSRTSEEVNAHDTLEFDPNFNVTGAVGAKTTGEYKYSDSLGGCYNRTLVATAQKLVSVTSGLGCKDTRTSKGNEF